MADTEAIRRKMRKKNLTVQQVAELLSMDQSTFHRKLNKGGVTFSIKQAQILARALEMSPEDEHLIFFAPVECAKEAANR